MKSIRKKFKLPLYDMFSLTAVMRSIYFWLYVVSKLGMLYTCFQENWIGLIGFGIATGVSYVEMMKRS